MFYEYIDDSIIGIRILTLVSEHFLRPFHSESFVLNNVIILMRMLWRRCFDLQSIRVYLKVETRYNYSCLKRSHLKDKMLLKTFSIDI